MATQRLRRAFRYPSEDEISPDEMDEEQQEQLITDLQTQDVARTSFYRIAFLANPLLAALFFATDFITSSSALQRLKAFISLSSLLVTAYVIHFMPLGAVDTKGKKPVYLADAAKSPIERYLPLLNGVLVGVLLVGALSSLRTGDTPESLRQAAPASESRSFAFVSLMLNHCQ